MQRCEVCGLEHQPKLKVTINGKAKQMALCPKCRALVEDKDERRNETR